MSTHDHSICNKCRSVECTLEVRCSECSNWSDSDMQEYLKLRKALESKSKSKKEKGEPSTSSSSKTPKKEQEKTDVEAVIKSQVEFAINNFMQQFMVVRLIWFLQLPCWYLISPSWRLGVGRNSIALQNGHGSKSRAPGVVPTSNLDPPHSLNVSCNVSLASIGHTRQEGLGSYNFTQKCREQFRTSSLPIYSLASSF